MKSKDKGEVTIEELNAKKKTLSIVVMLLSGIILLYLVYFVTKLINGTWQANNLLAMVGICALVVSISTISIQLSQTTQEIKKRSVQQ